MMSSLLIKIFKNYVMLRISASLLLNVGNVLEDFELLADYDAEADKSHQLSAKAGEIVVVMRKDDSGTQ